MAGGFYQMYRGWMENPVFAGESFSRAQAWCWLIEYAVWKERKIDVRGRTVTLERGQLCYSTRYLATAWGWSEAKVRRFTTRLKTDAMIDAESDAGQTLITICNYDKYQATPDTSDAPSDALRDAEATQERRTSDANKNKGKEREKGNKALSDERAYTGDPKHADSGPLSDESQTTRIKPPLPSLSPAQQEKPPPKSGRAKRVSRLPDDWNPSEADRQYAAKHGYSAAETEHIAANFHEHWTNKSSKACLKRDWSRAWQTWVRNETEYRPPARAQSNGASHDERRDYPARRKGGSHDKSSSAHRNALVGLADSIDEADRFERDD